jgi:hypothetical protein
MFVRFRQAGSRLQCSLIETSRSNGKVRHEHIAALGTIDTPPAVADRAEFWRRLHERIGQLSNRVDGTAQAKILGEIHARIPMVMIDELRTLQVDNIQADEQVWTGLLDIHQSTLDGDKQVLAGLQKKIEAGEAAVKVAAELADGAKEKARRLQQGEAVAGGLKREVDMLRIMRDAGMTDRDIDHCRMINALSELGGFEEFLAEVHKRHRRAEFTAARAVLRRRWVQRERQRMREAAE